MLYFLKSPLYSFDYAIGTSMRVSLMDNKKIDALSALAELEAEIENFLKTINLKENIRMNFMEQSARYIGVYVEHNSLDLLNDKKLN